MKKQIIGIAIIAVLTTALVIGVLSYGWGAKNMAKKQDTVSVLEEEAQYRNAQVDVDAAFYLSNSGRLIHLDEYDLASVRAGDTVTVLTRDRMMDVVILDNWESNK